MPVTGVAITQLIFLERERVEYFVIARSASDEKSHTSRSMILSSFLLIYVFSLLNACNLYEFNKPLSFGGAIYVSNNLSTVNVSREVDSEKVIDTAKDKIVFSGILPDSFSSDDKSNYVYLSESELSSSKDKLIADVKSIGDNILHNSDSFDL